MSERAKKFVDDWIARMPIEQTWARLVRRGWARYTEVNGVLDIELTDAGRARATELKLRDLRANN